MDVDAIRIVCDEMRRATHALATLVSDADGRELGRSGEIAGFDAAFVSALLRSETAAPTDTTHPTTAEVARRFAGLGAAHAYVVRVGEDALLGVLFDRTSSLG